MKTYRYDSPDGTLTLQMKNGEWVLEIFGYEAGRYISAEDAASDVAAHNTGYVEWDENSDFAAPESLEEWER